MNHCVVMTAYKDVEQINRFINLAPKNFDFYVHLDKKSTIDKSALSARAKVFSVYNIFWGVEHLKAFLFLLKEAYSSGKEYDFFHLCTGQDFFACPLSSFDSKFREDTCYLDFYMLPKKNWWHGGFYILKYKTLASFCDVRKPMNRIANFGFYLYQWIFIKQRPLPMYKMACGAVYCSLPKGAVEEYLFGDVAQDLLERLSDTTCGEEVFFQTVLWNSKYREKIVKNNLRYVDWTVKAPPKFLEECDYKKIVDSDNCFCRKIDSVKSKSLIDKLEKYVVEK